MTSSAHDAPFNAGEAPGTVSRRRFLQSAAAIGAGLSFPAIVRASSIKERNRPNVIVAVADDWSWPHASIAGDPTIKTPVFDRICREGMWFDNAFVTSPSCAPSRATMLTGRYHWELGPGANMWGTLPRQFRSYPDILERAGYHVGFSGKGWGPGLLPPGRRARNPAGKRYANFYQFLLKRKAEQPFCFWFGSHYPHRRYVYKSGLEQGLDPATVQVPGHLPDTKQVRIDICDYYGEVQDFDTEVGKIVEILESVNELDNTILIVTSDNGMPFPRCKANLYDLGTHIPLAIRWKALSKTGYRSDTFVSLCDLAPSILDAAGIQSPVPMSGKSLVPYLTGNFDSPTLPMHRPYVITGRERHIAAQQENRFGYPMRAIESSDYLYIRNFRPGRWPAGSPPQYRDIDRSPTKQAFLENARNPKVAPLFELAFGRRPAEELYDLRSDPWQMHNVADDPAYQQTRNRLWGELSLELMRTHDPRMLGEGDRFDHYPYYMLKRIYQ